VSSDSGLSDFESTDHRRLHGDGEDRDPAEATVKVSLRLVPDQKLKTVERQFARRSGGSRQHVQRRQVPAWRGPGHGEGDASAFKLLDQAFREVVGRGTVPARAGGSIRLYRTRKGGAQSSSPASVSRRSAARANEKLDLKQLWDGIKVFGDSTSFWQGSPSTLSLHGLPVL